jgi:hypothetical protein
MERQYERQEGVRHVSNSHSFFKQTDPELERLKQEIAEARAKQEQRQETTGNISNSDSYLRQSDLEIERLQQEVAEARAKQNRELARARPEVEEDSEHEGVKCHVCGWQGSVRDLKPLPNVPNQVDTEMLCPSCESKNLSSLGQQPPSQSSNPDPTYKSAHKTQYSPTSATLCCGGWCSLL